MKTFLCKNKIPIIKWGMLPDNTFYKGEIPEGYSLAVVPSEGYIVIDVDKKKDKNGFKHIPAELRLELENTFNYYTKNDGRHYWFRYTGNRTLLNKSTKLGIDLRTHRGYVVWYLPFTDEDYIKWCMNKVNTTSLRLNNWLESLFINNKENDTTLGENNRSENKD